MTIFALAAFSPRSVFLKAGDAGVICTIISIYSLPNSY